MDRRRQLDRYSRTLLSEAVAEGAIRPVGVRIASNHFLGAVNWVLRRYSEGDERSADAVSQIFLDLLINGIAGQAQQSPNE